MTFPSVAHLVKRHVRLHTAQRVIERFSAGESFTPLLHELSPELRRSVEGLLRAAAESWANAVADLERKEISERQERGECEESGEGHWLR